MVTENSTRKRKRASHGPLNNASREELVHAVTLPLASLDAQQVSSRLFEMLKSLQHSMSIVIVWVEALRRQDADADVMLQRCSNKQSVISSIG